MSRKIEKLALQVWSKVDLSPSHAYLLMMVLDEPGIQPSALVDELLLTPSTITRLIEKLEEKKLVYRTTEGKITNVYATAKAKDIAPKLNSCVEEFYKSYSSILGKEESAQMVQRMNKITDKLEV
ncbi:MAG TPA: MarR family transcriptional regulator [Lacibacter sp.]|nr:MarR family transcriptional regulator [Lacibacter sp.]